MLDFDFVAEKKSLKDIYGNSFEYNIFAPKKIDLNENVSSSFFSDCSKNNINLVIYPLEVADILTKDADVYNEAFLSMLRKCVNIAQEFSIVISFQPIYKNIDSRLVTYAMKHTARRLKNCDALIGFTLPNNEEFKNEKVRQFFVDELSVKHEQYKFFVL